MSLKEEVEEITIKTEDQTASIVCENVLETEDADDNPDDSTLDPVEITDKSLDDVMKLIGESNPVFKYLKVARSTEYSHQLRYYLSTNHNGVFLRVTNKLPDLYLLFKNNLSLIVRNSGQDLFCTLYNFKHQIFKGMVIKDFDKYMNDTATTVGISMFLQELDKDRYRVCSGAFTEDEFTAKSEQLQSILIEKFESSIVYRSRECFSLVPNVGVAPVGCGTSTCECCLKLKLELTKICSSGDELEDCVDETTLSSFVEVCMDSDDNDDSINIPSYSQDESWNGDTSLQLVDNQEEDRDSKDHSDSCDKENYDDMDIMEEFPSVTKKHQQRKVKTTKVSYKKLIISAILSSRNNMMKLTEIYDWILERYPLFNLNKTGFQNSIRHNLSLNRIFVKVSANPGINKGCYWTLEPNELKVQKDWTLNDKDGNNLKEQSKAVHKIKYKIKLPPKPPASSSIVKDNPPRKDLGISSRYIAIAPKPTSSTNSTSATITTTSSSSTTSQCTPEKKTHEPVPRTVVLGVQSMTGGDNYTSSPFSESQSDDIADLEKAEKEKQSIAVMNEKSDSLKHLPDNLKLQLKKGLPIILRPVDKPSTSAALPIIIQPSSVISLNPIVANTSGNPPTTSTNSITLMQRSTPSTTIKSSTQTPTTANGTNFTQRLHDLADPSDGVSCSVKSKSVASNEFPKPPFNFKELCMISIFYSPEKQMSLANIYDHVKLWFPYYRQNSIGFTWMNSIRHSLSLNSIFQRKRCYTGRTTFSKWTFDENDPQWVKLLTSNKWFETPVDADLFEYMAKNCPSFQQRVYSKRSMFKTVPITVKADSTNEEVSLPSASKGIKLTHVDSEQPDIVCKHETVDSEAIETVEDLADDGSGSDGQEDPLGS